MLYVIHGVDKPHSPIREALIDEHRAYLEACPLDIVASGPLVDETGTRMIGSVVVVDCAHRGEVDRMMADEPFNRAGLYESLHVNRWFQRVGEIAEQPRETVSA
ncbi:MAG: YciI family protein [Pseudomonadota bacterium]